MGKLPQKECVLMRWNSSQILEWLEEDWERPWE